MSKKIKLTLRIIEGDAGCRVEVKEFGVTFGGPDKVGAICGVTGLITDHCVTLVKRGNTSQATPDQLELARQINEHGFEFEEEKSVRNRQI